MASDEYGVPVQEKTPRARGPAPADRRAVRRAWSDHPQAVPRRVQVAHPVQPGVLVARHLGDLEAGLRDPHVDEGFHLESVAPQLAAAGRRRRGRVEAEHRQAVPPEDVVAVAEVGVPAAVAQVEDRGQPVVAELPQPGDVAAPPAQGEPSPLGESAPATSASTNRGISPGSAEPSASSMTMTSPVAAAKPQASAFPLPAWSIDHENVGTRITTCFHGVVRGFAIDQDHLVDAIGNAIQNMRYVALFIKRRDNDRVQMAIARKYPPWMASRRAQEEPSPPGQTAHQSKMEKFTQDLILNT